MPVALIGENGVLRNIQDTDAGPTGASTRLQWTEEQQQDEVTRVSVAARFVVLSSYMQAVSNARKRGCQLGFSKDEELDPANMPDDRAPSEPVAAPPLQCGEIRSGVRWFASGNKAAYTREVVDDHWPLFDGFDTDCYGSPSPSEADSDRFDLSSRASDTPADN